MKKLVNYEKKDISISEIKDTDFLIVYDRNKEFIGQIFYIHDRFFLFTGIYDIHTVYQELRNLLNYCENAGYTIYVKSFDEMR